MEERVLEIKDRYWVIHEKHIGMMLVRCFNGEINPAEALAMFQEQAAEDGEAEE